MLDQLMDKPKVKLHIGKSSGGWCFSLHVIPELGLNSLRSWYSMFRKNNNLIVNEYQALVSIDKMLAIITNRGSPDKIEVPDYNSNAHKTRIELKHYLDANGAILGPNNLLRHRIDGSCIGHGTGTWDFIKGNFS
jgi:hypothetical protein